MVTVLIGKMHVLPESFLNVLGMCEVWQIEVQE